MNSGLDKIRVIESGKLDSEYYFQSLLQQAYFNGLLRDNDIERLQYESLNLLAYKTEKYNAGDSSSIPVEKAQDIMTSNLFTISLWLKTCPTPDDAVRVLLNEPISEIYKKGRRRINTKLALAKTIHASLINQIVDTPNVFYRSTIDGGIRGFFKLYYPDFAAHEINITADYPVFNPMPKLAGIEFILEYLNSLYYENLFCSFFPGDDIHYLLSTYVRGYEEHLINIYEPILLSALGCAIVGSDVRRLGISESGVAYLCSRISDATEDNITELLQNGVSELTHIFGFSQGLVKYIRKSLPGIIARILREF